MSAYIVYQNLFHLSLGIERNGKLKAIRAQKTSFLKYTNHVSNCQFICMFDRNFAFIYEYLCNLTLCNPMCIELLLQ